MELIENWKEIIVIIGSLFGAGGVFWGFIQGKADVKKNKLEFSGMVDDIYVDMTTRLTEERERVNQEMETLRQKIIQLEEKEEKYLKEREEIIEKIKSLEAIGKSKDKQIAELKQKLKEKEQEIE